MVSGTPQGLSKSLFERLREMVVHKPLPLEVVRLRNDAQKLVATDAVAAHQILGGLAALEFEVDAVRQHYRAALQLSNDAQVHSNYAVSLQFLGLYDEASEYALRAAHLEPENLTYLRNAIDYLTYAGRIGEALRTCAELDKREPGGRSREQEIVRELKLVMERTGVSEHEVHESFRLAFELLRENKLRFDRIGSAIELAPNGGLAHFTIFVSEPVDRVRRLDFDLGARLAERLDEMHSASFVVDIGSTAISTNIDERRASQVS